MTDSDKPETPPPPPASQEATPPPEAAAPTPPAAPAKPGVPARFVKRKPPAGGGGDMPNRRMRESVVSLDDEMRYKAGPRLKDLDDEIAEAAQLRVRK